MRAEARFSSAPTPAAISTAPSFSKGIEGSPFVKTINHSPTGITRNISSLKPITGVAESRVRLSQVMKSKPVWMKHPEAPVKPRVVFDRSKPSVPRITSPFELKPEPFRIPSGSSKKNRVPQPRTGRVIVDKFNPIRVTIPELKPRLYSPDGTVSKQDLSRSRVIFQRPNATPLPAEITPISPKQNEHHRPLKFIGISEKPLHTDFRDRLHKKKLETAPQPKVVLPPEVRLKIREKQKEMVDKTRKALVATGAFSSGKIESLLTQRKQQKPAEQKPQFQQRIQVKPIPIDAKPAVLAHNQPQTRQLISPPYVEVSHTGGIDSKEALALLLEKRKKKKQQELRSAIPVEHAPTTQRRIRKALAVVLDHLTRKGEVTGEQLSSALTKVQRHRKFTSPIILSKNSERTDGGWVQNIKDMRESIGNRAQKNYARIKEQILSVVYKYPAVTTSETGRPVEQHVVSKIFEHSQLPIKHFTVYQYSPTG